MGGSYTYQQGDSKGRAQFALVLLGFIGFCALTWVGHTYFETRAVSESRHEQFWSAMDLTLIAGSLSALLFVEGLWLWSRGRRILAAQRTPPPGVSVPFRVRVRTGPEALRFGRLVRFIAILELLLGGILLVETIWVAAQAV